MSESWFAMASLMSGLFAYLPAWRNTRLLKRMHSSSPLKTMNWAVIV